MRRWLPGVMLGLGIAGAGLIAREAFTQEKAPHPTSRAEAKDFKNPILHSRASVAQGKNIYIRNCQYCHGMDGRALDSPDFIAADLTRPQDWLEGSDDGNTFFSIWDGAADNMPPFKVEIKSVDHLWHLVNYVHTFRPNARPLVEPPKEKEDEKAEAPDEAPADPKKLKNPVAYTKASISKGRAVYMRNCQECHGFDGKALDSVAVIATDLTDPPRWRFGTTDGETYLTIRNGAGDEMVALKGRVKDEELDELAWTLVNYLRSIGPESLRPKLQEKN